MPENNTEAAPATPLPRLVSREALGAMGGYDYQVWLSIETWLLLGANEVLFLEGAEDIDRVAPDGTTTVQVKRTDDTISLNVSLARDSIKNFWATTERSPGRVVRFVYLTTSTVARELNADFGGLKGIDAWGKARHDAQVAELVRAYLLANLGATGTLLEFLKTASVQDLQQSLFSRFTWLPGRPAVEVVKASVTDRLKEYCASEGMAAGAAIAIRDKLFARCWEQVLRPELDARRLDWALLAQVQKEATTVHLALPLASAQGLLQVVAQLPSLQRQMAPLSLLAQEPPLLPANVLERPTLANQVGAHVRQRDAVMLSGSVYKGKTTLAAILAQRSGQPAQWIQLTGREASAVADIFRLVSLTLADTKGPDLIVFDDLDTGATVRRAYAPALKQMVHRARLAGKALLFTAQGQSETLATEVADEWGLLQIEVPALEADDVETLCLSMGCPTEAMADAYGKVIVAQTAGHPKLVQVRVQELAQASWPRFDIEALLGRSAAVRSAKQMARELLSESVPAVEAAFLYEAGEFTNLPSREMLLNLAELDPKVPGASAVLDRLQGRWVEAIGADRYRITPILRGEVDLTWTKAQYRKVHAKIHDAIKKSSPLAPNDGAALLFHAFMADDGQRMARTVFGLLEVQGGAREQLLAHLGWLVHIGIEEGQALPGIGPAYSAFRLLQFKVAAQESTESIPRVVAAWRRDIAADQSENDRKAASQWMMNASVLTNLAPVPFALILEAAEGVFFASDAVANLIAQSQSQARSQAEPLGEIPTDATTFQMLLALRASSVRTLEDLEVLTSWLERQTNQQLLLEFNTLCAWSFVRALGGFIHSAWAKAADTENPLWESWLVALDAAMAIAQCRELPAFGAELARAKSIILSEYMGRTEDGAEVLAAAASAFGPSAILAEQRVNLLYQANKHAEAVSAWQELIEQYGSTAIDDPFAYRRAAICAGKVGNFTLASKLFEEGSAQLSMLSPLPTRLGLLADASFCAWKAGDSRVASALLTRAALELPEAARSPTDFQWHATVVDLNRVAALQARIAHVSFEHKEIAYALGQGSRPDSSKENLVPDQGIAIQIFEAQASLLEAQWVDASEKLMQRAAALTIGTAPTVVMTASQAVLRHQLVAGVEGKFVDLCISIVNSVETAARQLSANGGPPFTAFQDEAFIGLFVCGLCCADDPKAVLEAWSQSCMAAQEPRAQVQVREILSGFNLPPRQIQEALFGNAEAPGPVRVGAALSLLHHSLGDAKVVSQTQGFLASAICLGAALFFASAMVQPVARRWARHWEEQLREPGQFGMPQVTIPQLRDLLDRARRGRVGLAELLSTTSKVVKVDLSEIVRKLPG